MNFLNPIAILDLKDCAPSEMDAALIRKKRKLLLAEIELADNNSIEIAGHLITKSEVETLAAALENTEHLAYYHFIYHTPLLQAFLANGDDQFFHPYTEQPMYKDPAFISFISPWFAQSYNQLLQKLFRDRNSTAFLPVIGTAPLILPQHRDEAYAHIVAAIRQFIDETNTSAEKAKTGNIQPYGIRPRVESMNVQMINALPPYFQSLRNDCAQAIREVAVNLFNYMQEFTLGLSLLDYAIQFNTDATISQAFEKERAHLDIVAKTSGGTFSLLDDIILGLQQRIRGISQGQVRIMEVLQWVDSNINMTVINALLPFATKKRNELAVQLNELANVIYDKARAAEPGIALVKMALAIKSIDDQAIAIYRANLARLENLKGLGESSPMYHPLPPEPESSGNSSFGRIILVMALSLFAIVRFGMRCNNMSKQRYANYNQPAYHYYEDPKVTAAFEKAALEANNWKGSHLSDGSTPFETCFGEGKEGGSYWLSFENKSSLDAIVCLVDVKTKKVIRNISIQSGSTMLMKRIPEGTYYIHSYLGRDWNPKKENAGGHLGDFQYDVHVFRSAEKLTMGKTDNNYIVLPDPGDSKPKGTVITAKEFFKK